MTTFVSLSLLLVLSGLLVSRATAKMREIERQIVWMGFAAHLVSAFAQVIVTTYFYGGGDILLYSGAGRQVAQLLMEDFGTWAPRVALLLAGDTASFPFPVYWGSTATMIGLSGLVSVFTGGSIITLCMIFGTWAFSGQYAIYRVLRTIFPREYLYRVQIAVFLVPSVVFWTSGVLKEAVALGALGWAFWGIHAVFFTDNRLRGVAACLVAIPILSTVRAFMLYPLVISSGAWVYWHRRGTGGTSQDLLRRGLTMLVVGAFAILVLNDLTERYPRYSIENVAEEAANLQDLFSRNEGGSAIAYTQQGAAGQVQNLPIALFSALFRPLIFEVHNATSFVTSLETTATTLLLLLVLYRRRARSLARIVAASPFLVFSISFVLIFAAAVGLAAPNLGSLSRYRSPVMLFYAVTLVALLPLPRAKKAPALPTPT